MAPPTTNGLQAYSGSNSVCLRECLYTVEIHDFVANVTADLTYTNDSATEEVVLFNFPRKLNETSYVVHNCEATLGIEMVTTSVLADDEAKKEVGSDPLNQSVITDADFYHNMLGILPPHSDAKVVVEFTFPMTLQSHDSLFFMVPAILTGGSDIDVKADVRICTPYEVTGVDGVTKVHKERSSGPLRFYSWTTTNTQKDTTLEFTVSLKMNKSQKNGLSVAVEDGQKTDKDNIMHGRLAMLSAWFSAEDFQGTSSGLGEFIFIVDRSGSMGGARIQHARETLLLFLKSLPVGCYFNIISFGESHVSLFKKSQPYGPGTLEKAIKLQSKMGADMGCTNFARPLETALAPPLISGHPRYVFVLTDGIAHDKVACEPVFKRNAHKARMCAFGIGSGVDKPFIEQIAKQGNGMYDYIEAIDRQMETKIMTALRRMMDTCVTNVKVDWPEGVKAEMLTDVPSQIYPGRHWVTFARICENGKSTGKKAGKKSPHNCVTLSYDRDGKTVTLTNDLAGAMCDSSSFKTFPLHHQLATNQLMKAAEVNDVGRMLKLCTESGIHHEKFALLTRNAATDSITGVVRTQRDVPVPVPAAPAAAPPPAHLGTAGAALRRPRGGRVTKNSLDRIPKTAFKNLAKRGGIARLSGLMCCEMRGCLRDFLEKIIRDTVIYVEHDKKRTVTEQHVDCALRKNGIKLFGFQEPALYKHEVNALNGRPRARCFRRTTPFGNPAATASIASVLGVSPTPPVRRESSRRPTTSVGSKRAGSLRKSTSNASLGRSSSSSQKSAPALTKKPTLIINDTDQVAATLSTRASKRVSNTSNKSTETPSPSTSKRTASKRASAKRKLSFSPSDAGNKKSKPSARKGKQGEVKAAAATAGKRPLAKSRTRSQRTGNLSKGAKDFMSMVNLISLQNFDGTWDMSKALADILQEDSNFLISQSPIKDVKTWATVLAITYLEVNFKEAETEWEMIKDKAVHFVKSSNPGFGGLTLEGLESKATTFV